MVIQLVYVVFSSQYQEIIRLVTVKIKWQLLFLFQKTCIFASAIRKEYSWLFAVLQTGSGLFPHNTIHDKNARMAKLVDALVSGTSVGYNVQVRVLFRTFHAQVVKLVYTLLWGVVPVTACEFESHPAHFFFPSFKINSNHFLSKHHAISGRVISFL